LRAVSGASRGPPPNPFVWERAIVVVLAPMPMTDKSPYAPGPGTRPGRTMPVSRLAVPNGAPRTESRSRAPPYDPGPRAWYAGGGLDICM
jgi:hypothetical protein